MQYKRQRSKDCKSEHLQILHFLAWGEEERERERERERESILRQGDHS